MKSAIALAAIRVILDDIARVIRPCAGGGTISLEAAVPLYKPSDEKAGRH